MTKRIYVLITAISLILLSIGFSSCKKDEGLGGNASIKGNITKRVYDSEFKVFQESVPSVDEDVYIIFGSDKTIGDDTKTSPTGQFEFNYLMPGKYTIYFYTEDSVTRNRSKKEVVSIEVNLFKGETLDLGELIQYKTLDFDEGNASAKGIIGALYYSNNYTYLYSIGHAMDLDVYLVYNNRLYPETRIRTMYDGTYVFPNLIKGNYKVYAYSDNKNGIATEVTREFTIENNHQVVQVDSMTVNIETNYKL